jgi:hypothetical protein
VFAVGGAGDAAEVVWIGGEDGFGGFPDGGGVFVEGEFVEDEVAAEAAGGAGVGSEDFDAAGLAVDGDASFGVEGFEAVVGGEVDLFEGAVEKVADFGAAAVEFDAIRAGVGENGDEAARAGEEAFDGPCSEGEGFSGLAGPEEDLDAGGVVVEDGALVGAEGNLQIAECGFRIADFEQEGTEGAENRRGVDGRDGLYGLDDGAGRRLGNRF